MGYSYRLESTPRKHDLWTGDGVSETTRALTSQLPRQLNRLRRKASAEIIHFSLRLLKFRYRNQAVPLLRIQLIHRIAYGHSQPGFSLAGMSRNTRQNVLAHPLLAEYKPNHSGWALPIETINFLQREIERQKPDIIIEFGSGFSSVCFSQFMCDLYGKQDRIYVCSIEQSTEYAEKTRGLARAVGMETHIAVIHAPLSTQRIEGIEAETYTIPKEGLRDIVIGREKALIVVDGPFGNGLARFATLPMLHRSFPGKHVFYLDDALRSKELAVLSHWSRLDYVHVRGVYLLGRGLAVGETG